MERLCLWNGPDLGYKIIIFQENMSHDRERRSRGSNPSGPVLRYPMHECEIHTNHFPKDFPKCGKRFIFIIVLPNCL